MEPLTIGIIVCIIIAIILAVFFLTRKNPDKPAEPSVLENTLKMFNIGYEKPSAEHFSTDIVFETEADIQNNFMVFIKSFYPKINIDEINRLLGVYSVNKKMEEIVTENKNKIAIIDLMSDSNLVNSYFSYIYDNKNDEQITVDLYILILIWVQISNIARDICDIKAQLPTEYKNLKYIKYTTPEIKEEDYPKITKVDIYVRTNYNEAIESKDAVDYEKTDFKSCMTTQLCMNSIDMVDFIKRGKEEIIANMDTGKKIFNLVIVKYLLTLNGSNLDKITFDINSLNPKSSSGSPGPSDLKKSQTENSLNMIGAQYKGFSNDKKTFIQSEYSEFVRTGNDIITAINNGQTDISALDTAFGTAQTNLMNKINSYVEPN